MLFKLYRQDTLEGLKPYLSHHFNLAVELPPEGECAWVWLRCFTQIVGQTGDLVNRNSKGKEMEVAIGLSSSTA